MKRLFKIFLTCRGLPTRRGPEANRRLFFEAAGLLPLLVLLTGCAAPKKEAPSRLPLESTCIQGTVWMSSPLSSSPMPFSQAKVTAWRHGTDEPVGEVIADPKGNYCIRLPLAGFRIDLRVWGLVAFRGKNYTCKASVNNIDLGVSPKTCGEDCIRIDVMTECSEYTPARRYN